MYLPFCYNDIAAHIMLSYRQCIEKTTFCTEYGFFCLCPAKKTIIIAAAIAQAEACPIGGKARHNAQANLFRQHNRCIMRRLQNAKVSRRKCGNIWNFPSLHHAVSIRTKRYANPFACTQGIRHQQAGANFLRR